MATTTRTPRGSGELLRERLLDAAVAIVGEQGDPSHVTIRALTKRAGVSPTAFYLHFANREELLDAVVDRGFTGFRERMHAGVAAAGEDPAERLLGAGLAYLRFAEEQPALYTIIFGPHEHPADEGHAEEMSAPGAAAFADLEALITAYMGEAAPGDAALRDLAIGIWSGLHGYATLCHTSKKEDWPGGERFARMLAEAWLGGYAER